MIFRYSVHPKGLDPFQAAKAWHLRVLQGMPWNDVRLLVRTVSGVHPGQDALEDAVARVESQRHTAAFKKSGVTSTGYANCGRAPLLTLEQKAAVIGSRKRQSVMCELAAPARFDLKAGSSMRHAHPSVSVARISTLHAPSI